MVARKAVELEALRGIAALTVVIAHYMGSFTPLQMGGVPGFDQTVGLLGSPWFAIANGPAAVCVFFVLSGFVLPLAFFRSSGSDIPIVRAAAKRWFRLVFLVFIATMVSYCLFRFGLYHYKEAGEITGSPWLRTFGSNDPDGTFVANFKGAILQGTLLTFLRNTSTYDVVLWTMYHEFFGSFLTFGLAICLKRSSLISACWFILGAAVIVQFVDPRLISFVVGTALAFFMCRYEWRIRWPIAALCIVLGVYLYGYGVPRDSYAWMLRFRDNGQMGYDMIYVHTICGALLIVGFFGTVFGRMLSLPVFRIIGRLSFPIYVIHVPLICSLASYLFVVGNGLASYSVVLAIVTPVFAVVVVIASYLLAVCDENWLRLINRWSYRLIPDNPRQIVEPVLRHGFKRKAVS